MERTNIIITIDTEALAQGALPIETDVYGQVGGQRYGVGKIMDLCEAHGFRATFFVDAVEHHLFGKPALERLCRDIHERRHDVQLHIHPNLIPGQYHRLMCQYDAAAQERMVRDGKELIEAWTGRPPVAFRAGSYGANLDTIRALKANGFRIDSSYFSFHKNCALSRELNNRYTNTVFEVEGVTEIPVTVYRLFGSIFYGDYSKIDINACSGGEIGYVIEELVGRVGVLILFLHSFSFITRDARGGVRPDLRGIEKFACVLDRIARRKDVDVLTMEQYCGRYLDSCAFGTAPAEFVPTSKMTLTIARLASRYIRQ